MGAALGKRWAASGHQVLFSYSTDAEKLARLARFNEHTQSGTVAQAAAFGEVIMLAVPPPSLTEVLANPEPFANKLLISCVSGLRPDFTGSTVGLPTDLIQSVAEQIAQRLPDTRVVEAFNITFAQLIEEQTFRDRQASVFYCSDHSDVKETVCRLIHDAGYVPVNAGPLLTARSLETLASAWVQFAVVSGMFPRLGINVLKG
ncbi:NADPH-dependent F420 reductase [Spirosoma areae]